MWTFIPIYKQPIWSGHSLAAYKGDATALHRRIGESWEISDVDGNASIVASGPDAGLSIRDIIRREGETLLGQSVMRRYGTRFPLLIKLIDTDADLSVQVHPDDAMAHTQGHPFGKNEMWVILDSRPGAELACGFKNPVSTASLTHLVETGEIVKTLRYSPVKPGDAFFIPAGRVHAIGAGIMLAEIQQSSDDTFRLYDYNRTDSEGNPRQLHLRQAAKALNYNDTNGKPIPYEYPNNDAATILRSPYFNVNIIETQIPIQRDYSALDSFVCIMAVAGSAELQSESGKMSMTKGTTLLMPASDNMLAITPGADGFRALEIYLDVV